MTQSPEGGPPSHPEFDPAPGPPNEAPDPDRTPAGAPREIKAAVVVLTVLAAVLVFFGALYLVMVEQLQSDLRASMDELGQGASITDAQLRLMIRLVGGFLLFVGLGNGLTVQGLRSRRVWARRLGFFTAGAVVVLGLLAVATGSFNLPLVILTGLAVAGVFLLSKPAVRTYLSAPVKRSPY